MSLAALEATAGTLIVADSRGEDVRAAKQTLTDQVDGPEALRLAGQRQLDVVYGTRLAGSQAGILVTQINAATTTATALKANLQAVKAIAETDLDNPDAGDAAITALTTLLTAMATAKAAVSLIPNLRYETYRDE
ncbi:hypothetical protein [Aestuariivirga sp.]|uniref:hypothetical protein n=1 Tax=Aestuariivirga sp. TaxID=2650926 RepID=UPI0035933A2A